MDRETATGPTRLHLRALATAAQKDSSLTEKQPYKAIPEQDKEFFAAVGQQQPEAIMALEEALAANWRGTKLIEFDRTAARTTSPT